MPSLAMTYSPTRELSPWVLGKGSRAGRPQSWGELGKPENRTRWGKSFRPESQFPSVSSGHTESLAWVGPSLILWARSGGSLVPRSPLGPTHQE